MTELQTPSSRRCFGEQYTHAAMLRGAQAARRALSTNSSMAMGVAPSNAPSQ